MTRKALVILSGGQDSTTCLFWARQNFDEVHAITFDYGQRHSREIWAARRVAFLAGVASHEVLTLGPVLKGRSPLTDPQQPLEQYQNHDQMEKIIGDRVELTFVPMRNALFLTLAANRAICLAEDGQPAPDLVTGVCEADNANYPDCRLSFIDSMSDMIYQALGVDVGLHICTPLMTMSKAQSVEFAAQIPGAFEALAFSHTAYDGKYPPVGHDHATVLRAYGFEQAGRPDPLVLRAALIDGVMELPDTKNYKDDDQNQKHLGVIRAYQTALEVEGLF